MSLHEALVISCDTVFYELAYGTYQHDHPKDNVVTSPTAPMQEMQKMEVCVGIRPVARNWTCPSRGAGSIPTREWLYYLWKGQRSYRPELVQVRAGPMAHMSSRSNIRTAITATSGSPARRRSRPSARATFAVTPLQLANAYVGPGQRRQAVQPPDRPGHHQPQREGGAEDQAPADPAPAGGREHPGLHPETPLAGVTHGRGAPRRVPSAGFPPATRSAWQARRVRRKCSTAQ